MSAAERLKAKIRAVNRAAEAANAVYDQLAPIFSPYLGKKVKKKEGGLLEAIKKQLPDFPYSTAIHVYPALGVFSLAFEVKAREDIKDEHSCVYHSFMVYFGDLKDGVLVQLSEKWDRRTNWTYEEVSEAQAKIEKLRKELRDAESEIYLFNSNY